MNNVKYRIYVKVTSKEFVTDHHSMFNKDNLFYCSDVETISTISTEVHKNLTSNGTKSVLQAANVNNEKYLGYLCISNCSKQTTWSSNQVRTFSILSKIIFSAIGKITLK